MPYLTNDLHLSSKLFSTFLRIKGKRLDGIHFFGGENFIILREGSPPLPEGF